LDIHERSRDFPKIQDAQRAPPNVAAGGRNEAVYSTAVSLRNDQQFFVLMGQIKIEILLCEQTHTGSQHLTWA